MADELFDDLSEQRQPGEGRARGRARLREPVRDQIELRMVDLDSIVGTDHPVRVVWDYVCSLDLSALEDAIKSREGGAGHPAASPRLLLALWLFATSQGIGSGRLLDELCRSHDAYRWLCGGVSLNYHTLNDFRAAAGTLLDELLTHSVVALAQAGLIDLSRVSHDGMRVRAAAGASSFRRRATLESQLAEARDLVARLKGEMEDDPTIARTRMRAAQERAARERQERLGQALAKLVEIEIAQAPKRAGEKRAGEKRAPGKGRKPAPEGVWVPDPESAWVPDPGPVGEPAPGARAAASAHEPAATHQGHSEPTESEPAETKPVKAPRVSTTDPQARVIKMPDGGFRPGYNTQVTTAAGSGIIVGIDICASSSDRALLKPALEQALQRYGAVPGECLADGGFCSKEDIEWAAAHGCAVYSPLLKSKHGTNPYMARRDDGPGMAALRERMASEAGKASYKERSTTECVHGRMRQNDLHQFTVRGMAKAKIVMMLHALSNNIFQGHRMMREAGWG